MNGMEHNGRTSESGVSASVALNIYHAMREMVTTRGTRIPSRLDPLIQHALHASAGANPKARAGLERMSVQLDYLRAAQRARMTDEMRTCTANLAKLTSRWLDQTQMS